MQEQTYKFHIRGMHCKACELMTESELKEFPFGRCYILKIEALIEAKQAVGRPHDLITVGQLQVLKEKKQQQPDLF